MTLRGPAANGLWSRKSAPWLILAVILHGVALVHALWHQSFLVDDSIQYLTLADNLAQQGIFSQSYLPPFVPDVQRTPGYPVFLLLLGRIPWLVLLVQHLLIWLTGALIFRTLALYQEPKIARWAAILFLLQPYPFVLGSFILSEALFLTLLAATLYFYLRGRLANTLRHLVPGILLAVAATYVRPVGLILLVALGLDLVIRAIQKRLVWWLPAACFGIMVLLLGPWLLRNEALTGRYTLSTMGEMGMLHGRLGGMATDPDLPPDEHNWYMAGDSIAAATFGWENIRSYPDDNQSHETERLHPGSTGLTLQYAMEHPGTFVVFTARNLQNMYSGLCYGWSARLTHNSTLGLLFAGLQLLIHLILVTAFIWQLFCILKWTSGHWLLFAMVGGILFLSAAVWADGRYRVPVDLIVLVLIGLPFRAGISIQGQHSAIDESVPLRDKQNPD